MRSPAALIALLLAGCAGLLGRGADHVTTTVGVRPDTAIRIATTQLRHHGYDVRLLDDTRLITLPRTIPVHLREGAGNSTQQWIIEVAAEDVFLMRGTRVRVAGFLVPKDAAVPAEGDAGAIIRQAIPISKENARLFGEIETMAGWIRDAARRRGR